MKHWKQRLHFYIATLAIMGAVSCTNEEVHIDSPTSPDVNTDKVKLTMKVSVPSSSGMTRTAMSTDTENALQEIKILAFKVGVNNVRTYAYTTDGKVSPDGKGGIKITADVKRSSSGSDKYRFLLIANPNEAIPALKDTSRLGNVKKLITYDCSGNWDPDHGIPMSGETKDEVISENTELKDIELTRAMARVDVGVNYTDKTNGSESVAGLDVFRLQSVSVYRSNKKGKVVADQGVSGPQREEDSPLTYTHPSEVGKDQELWSSNRQIYLPESEAGDFDTATCLIIGGQYSNAATPDWRAVPITYYRVDFMKDEARTPIKRNHRYIINITSVAGEGYANEQDALKNVPANISVQITEWNDGSLGDIEISGNTYFSCETRMINLGYKANDTITIKAESSVPVDEWKIEQDTAWNKKIAVTKVKSKDPNKANILFKALVNGDTYEADTLNVVMKVGYVTAKFKVVQDKGIFAQPDDIVVEGWSPSDKEEDILTDDPNK